MPISSGQQYSKYGNMLALFRETTTSLTSEGTKRLILGSAATLAYAFFQHDCNVRLQRQIPVQCNAKNLERWFNFDGLVTNKKTLGT